MKFMEELERQTNVAITENGAIGYATTFNKLLDFNWKVPSFRGKDAKSYVREVINSVTDLETLYRYIFFLRDVRGGMGERKLFREFIRELALMERDELKMVIPLISEYGRWDDLFVLKGTVYEAEMLEIVSYRLHTDMINLSKGKPISLLAKWMPSNNASSEETRKLANYFTNKFGWTAKQYRKTLSQMRYYLKVTEAQISRAEYDKIDYASVPSYANMRYSKLFLTMDFDRRVEFLNSLKRGSFKVNASTLYPHEVLAKIRREGAKDVLLENLWKNLRDFGELSNTLVVADVSGSMNFNISNNVTAMDASIGLGMYFAERNKGIFKDKVVIFSEKPVLKDLSRHTSAYAKCQDIYFGDWGMNTNIEAVFNLILRTAKRGNCTQEEIPNILILSDMEFDGCVVGADEHTFKRIEDKFKAEGYSLPRITFWNLNSRTNAIPLIENELGVSLVSGYSPTCLKAVMSNKFNAYDALMDCIFVERYDKVANKIKDYVSA